MSLRRHLFVAVLALVASNVCWAQEGVRVCVTADRTLRQAQGEGCRSGERSYLLAEQEQEVQKPDPEDVDQQTLAELKREVGRLKERMIELERDSSTATDTTPASRPTPASPTPASKTAVAQRVTAPFEVVSSTGQVILRVQADGGVIARGRLTVQDTKGVPIVQVSEGTATSSRGLYVTDARNGLVVQLAANQGGGGKIMAFGDNNVTHYVGMAWDAAGPYIRMTHPGGKRSASLGEEGFQLYNEQDQLLVSIGEENAAGAVRLSRNGGGKLASLDAKGMTFYNEKEKGVARLGYVEGEGGNLLIGSSAGEQVIQLFYNEAPMLNLLRANGSKVASLGAHGFHLYNTDGKGIASLVAGRGQSGIFQLYSASGNTSVEAGTLDDGTGTVRAGPLYKCVAPVGLPTATSGGLPDCIKGRLK